MLYEINWGYNYENSTRNLCSLELSSTSIWSIKSPSRSITVVSRMFSGWWFRWSWNDISMNINFCDFYTMHTLYPLKRTYLFWWDKHDSLSTGSRSSCSSYSVNITLRVMWNVIVDNEIYIIHIQSTSCHISPDKYAYLSFLVGTESTHTISLMHITMYTGYGISISWEISFQLFCFVFFCSKNHHFVEGIFIENLF